MEPTYITHVQFNVSLVRVEGSLGPHLIQLTCNTINLCDSDPIVTDQTPAPTKQKKTKTPRTHGWDDDKTPPPAAGNTRKRKREADKESSGWLG